MAGGVVPELASVMAFAESISLAIERRAQVLLYPKLVAPARPCSTLLLLLWEQAAFQVPMPMALPMQSPMMTEPICLAPAVLAITLLDQSSMPISTPGCRFSGLWTLAPEPQGDRQGPVVALAPSPPWRLLASPPHTMAALARPMMAAGSPPMAALLILAPPLQWRRRLRQPKAMQSLLTALWVKLHGLRPHVWHCLQKALAADHAPRTKVRTLTPACQWVHARLLGPRVNTMATLDPASKT